MTKFDIRLDGFEPGGSEAPAQALGRLFGMTPDAADRLLVSLPRVVKREVEDERATRIVDALRSVGARANLEPSPIRPSAVMQVGAAARDRDRELPDIASRTSTPSRPVAHPTVVQLEQPKGSGTLVLTRVAPPAPTPAGSAASSPAPAAPMPAPKAAVTTGSADSGHTAELGPDNDPWKPKTVDPRSARTASMVGDASSAAPPAPPPAAALPAYPSPQPPSPEPVHIPAPTVLPASLAPAAPAAPAAPLAQHAPDAGHIAIPAPLLPQPIASPLDAPALPDLTSSERISIPAAAVAVAAVASTSDSRIEHDPYVGFPGIDLGSGAGVRSNDSMELTHDPLEFVSQPPPVDPSAGLGDGLADIDPTRDALALPRSDAPAPPPSGAAPIASLPPPAPIPSPQTRGRRPDSPILAALPWLAPRPRVTEHATAKAFGLLAVTSVLTLLVYAVFVR